MINKRLMALYQEYYGEGIVRVVPCGIVDEEIYSKVYPKIVFLLREAHMRTPYNPESMWTIPKGIARNAAMGIAGKPMELKYMRTWKQAGIWAYAIIHGFRAYSKLKQTSYVAQGLLSLGMTNLKKTGGGASSKWHEIRQNAIQEKDLWRHELEIMNPDLILCGGTYNHLIASLGLQRYTLHEEESRAYQYSILELDGKSSVVLSFWHPNNRRRRDANLETLKTLINRLKERKLL